MIIRIISRLTLAGLGAKTRAGKRRQKTRTSGYSQVLLPYTIPRILSDDAVCHRVRPSDRALGNIQAGEFGVFSLPARQLNTGLRTRWI